MTVSLVELGKVGVSWDTLERVVDILGYEVEFMKKDRRRE